MHARDGRSTIAPHGFYRVRCGRRRRYRCLTCGRTFSSTTGTPYHRLQHPRSSFDHVTTLSAEGLSKSAIARVTETSWNTVARWLERAAESCRRFADERIRRVEITELQADEIRTVVGSKDRETWIFSTLDVSSRLWPSVVIGNRTYRNTRKVLLDTARRMTQDTIPLITTDGWEFYEKVVRRTFGYACIYAQVLKTRRNDRIVKVERRQLIGTPRKFEAALWDSEDSSKLNTSFIERLNLTIRQHSSFLTRRTTAIARSRERLRQHMELLRTYYNFVRPHLALKFGRDIRTPAMQAGLVRRRLTLREIFSPVGPSSFLQQCEFLVTDLPMVRLAA